MFILPCIKTVLTEIEVRAIPTTKQIKFCLGGLGRGGEMSAGKHTRSDIAEG